MSLIVGADITLVTTALFTPRSIQQHFRLYYNITLILGGNMVTLEHLTQNINPGLRDFSHRRAIILIFGQSVSESLLKSIPNFGYLIKSVILSLRTTEKLFSSLGGRHESE